jgi:hypothetical protein
LTANRKDLLRDRRGAAIFVEFLIIIPLLTLLWMTTNHMHRLGLGRVQVQRQARQCTWAHATGGCQGQVPAACKMEGPTRLDAPELEQVAGTGLESAMRPVRGLSELFRRPTGDLVTARPAGTVNTQISGDVEMAGAHRMMCNERPSQLTDRRVAQTACQGLLGQGGRCP